MSDKKHEHKHVEKDKSPLINEDNLQKMLQSIIPLIEKAKNEIKEFKEHQDDHGHEDHGDLHDIMLQPAMLPLRSLDMLEDDDYQQGDIFNSFKNDLGGAKGLIKIIRVNPDDACERIASCLENMNNIRKATRLIDIRKAFEQVKMFADEPNAHHQIKAIKLLDKLANSSESDKERYAYVKAKKAVLSGENEMIDAAAFRIQNIFASAVPQTNLRVAFFENPRSQESEDYQLCPKARYQIGHAVPMPISSCRDNCIDSRTTQDGKVSCAYQDWLKHAADNHISAVERLDEVHPQVNAENKLNLKDGERFNPSHLAIDLMNFEQRMADKLKENKSNNKKKVEPDLSIEAKLDDSKLLTGHQNEDGFRTMEDRLRKPVVASKYEGIDPEEEISFGAQLDAKRAKLYVDEQVNQRLDEVSEPNLGRHGEPTMRMQDVNVKKAWNQSKFTKVDSESDDTMNAQLESRHEADLDSMETLEELLADAAHYYSDDEMEVLTKTMEELLSKSHKGY